MNVTRESISRLVQKWRRLGIIEDARGVITIIDAKKLEEIIGSD
jgi:CRP-like cAMP-binding protein